MRPKDIIQEIITTLHLKTLHLFPRPLDIGLYPYGILDHHSHNDDPRNHTSHYKTNHNDDDFHSEMQSCG